MNGIQQKLFTLQDEIYMKFTAALVPSVERDRFIGVRTPELRRIAKEIYGSKEACSFMGELPHFYHEENALHGFLIEQIKDEGELYCALDAFLPHITSWAVCDGIKPKLFKKHPPSLLIKVDEWLSSKHEYAVRFALCTLMSNYLDDMAFSPDILERAANVKREEYYIKMMVAWFFATALAKQYDSALPYITESRLDAWTHNKAIQKANESRRVTMEHKKELNELKL